MTDLAYLDEADAVGPILRDRDWSGHPLGPIAQWPARLHEVLQLCLHSNFPYIVYWGPQYLTFWNHAATLFFDAQHPQDLGRPLAEVQPDAMRTLRPLLEQVMATGRPVLCEDLQLVYRRHDYTEELYETFSYSPLIGPSGEVQGIITPIFDTTAHLIGARRLATLRDLAAETRGARSLRAFCQALAACLARNPHDLPCAALFVADAASDIGGGGEPLRLVSRTDEHTDWPASLSAPAEDTLHEQAASALLAHPARGAWDTPPDSLVFVPVIAGGPGRRAALLVAGRNPYKRLDADHRTFFTLVANQIGQGLTDTWAIEEASDRARAELASLTRLTAMGELATSIAHEVNQPLAAIVLDAHACLGWLGAEPPDLAEAQAAVRRIVKSGGHAGEVVARIRRFLHRAPPQRAPLDLAQVAWDGMLLIRGEAQRHEVALRMRLAPGLPAVQGDRVQIQQVVLNLLANAVEALQAVDGRPRVVTIEVGRSVQPAGVRVAVQDNGSGLDATDPARLFEAFYTTKPQGLGFGLSISRSIIESHGGTLWAEKAEPRGARFAFVLPTAETPETATP